MASIQELLQSKIKGKVVFKDEIEQKYLTDFIGAHVGHADAYVLVQDEEDIIQTLKIAYETKTNVVVRGAGTNLSGSTIPEGGIVLDVSGMNKILQLDENTLTVTVQPGVLLKDLIEFVESKGYLYAPDPAEKCASIGGNVSTNAGGMRAVKYGVTRNYVLSLDLIKVDGTKLTLGAKTYKNSTGLNLQQLVVGSEGTLGVISKIVLKLLPKPEYTLNVILGFNSLLDAIKNVNHIFKAKLDPTAIEFIEKKVVAYGESYVNKSFPCQNAKAYLIVSLDGSQSSVLERLATLKHVVLDNGAIDVIPLDDPLLAKDVWEIRGAVARSVNATGLWEPVDVVVPLDKISDYIEFVENITTNGGPRIVAFGHAGDGNVHLCILKDQMSDDTWQNVLHDTLDKIYKEAYRLGGLPSGEHSIGKGKREFYIQNIDPAIRQTMVGIKKSFDEYNILNPHCSYAL